jgi:hypothetical protein
VSTISKSGKPTAVLTDPNSLYRKLYNRSLDFFKWVIDKEADQKKLPLIFKLHVQAMSTKEIKVPMLKRSIEAMIPEPTEPRHKPSSVQIQFFSKKKQFKAFVEINDADSAKKFFDKTFTSKELTLLDNSYNEVFRREMRSYLVKTEEEFQQLAMEKYREEINRQKAQAQLLARMRK